MATNYPFEDRDWEAGLCGCFQDMGLCCDTFWCGYCMTGNYYEAVCLDHPESKNIPVSCGMVVTGICASGTLVVGIPLCIFAFAMRRKTREKYGIQGSSLRDCCASLWCSPCVLCQIHREVSHHAVPAGFCCCRPSILPKQEQVAVQPGYAVPLPPAEQGTAPPMPK